MKQYMADQDYCQKPILVWPGVCLSEVEAYVNSEFDGQRPAPEPLCGPLADLLAQYPNYRRAESYLRRLTAGGRLTSTSTPTSALNFNFEPQLQLKLLFQPFQPALHRGLPAGNSTLRMPSFILAGPARLRAERRAGRAGLQLACPVTCGQVASMATWASRRLAFDLGPRRPREAPYELKVSFRRR